jgi:acyl carrier protein phosphodiesterase
MQNAVAPLAGDAVAACVECHTNNTAVERTFVQFYPTLLEVARAKGTVKPGF